MKVVVGGDWWCWGVRGGGGGDDGVVGMVNYIEVVVNFGEEKEDEEMGYVEIEEGGGVFGVDGSGEGSRGVWGGAVPA